MIFFDINSVSWNSSIGELLPTGNPLDSHHPGPHLMRSFASSEGSFLGWLKSKIPALILKNGRHTFFWRKERKEWGVETLQVTKKKKITSTWLKTFKLPCTEETEHMFSLSRAIGLGVYSCRASFRVPFQSAKLLAVKDDEAWNRLEQLKVWGVWKKITIQNTMHLWITPLYSQYIISYYIYVSKTPDFKWSCCAFQRVEFCLPLDWILPSTFISGSFCPNTKIWKKRGPRFNWFLLQHTLDLPLPEINMEVDNRNFQRNWLRWRTKSGFIGFSNFLRSVQGISTSVWEGNSFNPIGKYLSYVLIKANSGTTWYVWSCFPYTILGFA